MQAYRGLDESQLVTWSVVVSALLLLVGGMTGGWLFAGGTGDPGAGPTLTVPCAVNEGSWLEGVATDIDGSVSVEVQDANGNVLHFSVDPGTSNSFRVFIPVDTPGPLQVTAADVHGYETTKSVDVVDTGQIEES